MWIVQEWIFANSLAFTVEKTIYSANLKQMGAVLARHETIHVIHNASYISLFILLISLAVIIQVLQYQRFGTLAFFCFYFASGILWQIKRRIFARVPTMPFEREAYLLENKAILKGFMRNPRDDV